MRGNNSAVPSNVTTEVSDGEQFSLSSPPIDVSNAGNHQPGYLLFGTATKPFLQLHRMYHNLPMVSCCLLALAGGVQATPIVVGVIVRLLILV